MNTFEIVIVFENGQSTFNVEAKTKEKAAIEAIKKYEKQKPKFMSGNDITSFYFRN